MADNNGAREQAIAQLRSITEMVAALGCDFDRLEEPRSSEADNRAIVAAYVEKMDDWQANANAAEELEELAELVAAAGEAESTDDARERIEEDALSVEVRSDWHRPGDTCEPAEFCILLCTGGPAVRIVGDLDRGQPSRPRLQYQDWFTPWTDLILTADDGIDDDALQAYCECFYFGE